MRYLTITIVFLVVLMLPAMAISQISCFTYPGGMLSCDGPRGNTIQQDFGNGQGVIMGPRGEITPYAVIPPPTERSRGLIDPPYLRGSQRPSSSSPFESEQPSPSPYFMPGFGGDAGGSPY